MQYIKGEEESEAYDDALLPSVSFAECPIRISAGLLGKKWTMVIIRNIGFRKIQRFNRLLEATHGITPRVLSQRLKGDGVHYAMLGIARLHNLNLAA